MNGINREPWMADAACLEIGAEPFFPEESQNATEAKAACRRCEVMDECLEYALSTNQAFGVWGGATYQERLNVKRRRRYAERGDAA